VLKWLEKWTHKIYFRVKKIGTNAQTSDAQNNVPAQGYNNMTNDDDDNLTRYTTTVG